MNKHAFFTCISCGSTYPLQAEPLTCPNHNQYYGYLSVKYPYSQIVKPDSGLKGWDKYADLLPVSTLKIGFDETTTPLIRAQKFGKAIGIPNLWIKDEGKNPTGSFKDKESCIAINAASELGIRDVVVVSSGSAAVSTSAYAQKAGMSCLCVVSKSISPGKRLMLGLYNAKVAFQDKSYEQMYRDTIDKQIPYWNVTPGYNPYKDEGIKIIGFEIWEEIGVPDIIICPCANGTLLWGLYKAFWELIQIGLISKLPRFIGVQIEGGAPLAQALHDGKEYSVLDNAPDSLAEGIIATESYSSPKATMAIRSTGGSVITVTDHEVVKAMEMIIQTESLIPEPTSAAVYAGLIKFGPSRSTVVAIQTANGMKNLKEIMEIMIKFRL